LISGRARLDAPSGICVDERFELLKRLTLLCFVSERASARL